MYAKMDPRVPVWARRMRVAPTRAEAALWERLRGRQIGGEHWRRQCPRFGYIADFCCIRLRLIVEADGGSHDGREARDARRDEHLRARGYLTMRFPNARIMGDLDGVAGEIAAAVDRRAREA